MRRHAILMVLVPLLAVLVSCAPGPNELVGTPDDGGRVAGFWHGLWHGFIVVFSFLASLIFDVRIYETHNSGGWYDFGFLLGVMMFFGGSGGEAHRRSRKC